MNLTHRVNMRRIVFLLSLVAVTLLGTGCTSYAPVYTASLDNVQKLKDAGIAKAKVGDFADIKSKENANPIGLRGSQMKSPYQDSYAVYLSQALDQELALANAQASTSNVEISGELLKNDVDATGISTGTADIQARFIVKKSGEKRYDKIQSAHTEWDSSFLGSIALPRAIQEYPNLVQKLLSTLYADNDFIKILK